MKDKLITILCMFIVMGPVMFIWAGDFRMMFIIPCVMISLAIMGIHQYKQGLESGRRIWS